MCAVSPLAEKKLFSVHGNFKEQIFITAQPPADSILAIGNCFSTKKKL